MKIFLNFILLTWASLTASVIYKFNISAESVSMSPDGAFVALTQREGDYCRLIIIKKKESTYQQIKVTNVKVYLPTIKKFNNLFRFAYSQLFIPKFSGDSQKIYFIDYDSGVPVQGELNSISKIFSTLKFSSQQYRQYCNHTLRCYFDVAGDKLVLINEQERVISLFNQSDLINNFSLVCYYSYYSYYSYYYDSSCLQYLRTMSLVNFEFYEQRNMISMVYAYDQYGNTSLFFTFTFSAQNGLISRNSGFSQQRLNFRKFGYPVLKIKGSIINLVGKVSENQELILENRTNLYNGSFSWPGSRINSVHNTLSSNVIGVVSKRDSLYYLDLIYSSQYNVVSLDLQVVESNKIMGFSMDKDGSRVSYINSDSEFFIIEQTFGAEQMIRCHTHNLQGQQCTFEQLAIISYVTLGLVFFLCIFVVISIAVICCRLKKIQVNLKHSGNQGQENSSLKEEERGQQTQKCLKKVLQKIQVESMESQVKIEKNPFYLNRK